MLSFTNTWGYQTAAVTKKKSGKHPTTKETWPKDASGNCPVAICPLSNHALNKQCCVQSLTKWLPLCSETNIVVKRTIKIRNKKCTSHRWAEYCRHRTKNGQKQHKDSLCIRENLIKHQLLFEFKSPHQLQKSPISMHWADEWPLNFCCNRDAQSVCFQHISWTVCHRVLSPQWSKRSAMNLTMVNVTRGTQADRWAVTFNTLPFRTHFI